MQYYTKELWQGINSPDAAVREQAEKQWRENALQYQAVFAETKQHLPRAFTEEYLRRGGFHDDAITSCRLFCQGNVQCCEMVLLCGSEQATLQMTGVTALHIDIPSFESCICGRLHWGYDELVHLGKNRFRLSVICDLENEFSLDFRAVQLTVR